MRIRFLTSLARSYQAFRAGGVYDMPESEAEQFIREGVAEMFETRIKLNFKLNTDVSTVTDDRQ